MNEYWFQQKRYGFGASPKTWEGWLSLLVFVVIVGGLPLVIEPSGPYGRPVLLATLIAIATLGFVFLVWRKTEGGWRWRWGDDQ